jgi:hypothetical protein
MVDITDGAPQSKKTSCRVAVKTTRECQMRRKRELMKKQSLVSMGAWRQSSVGELFEHARPKQNT